MSNNLVPKTSFAQTCNLLSQYVKEKRSVVDQFSTLGIAPKGAEHQMCRSPSAPVTLNLLSGMENVSSEEYTTVTTTTTTTTKPEIAPMTIFYGGQMFVFNDFSADKAREVMELATKGSSARSGSDSTNNVKGENVSNVVLSKLGPNLTTATTRPHMPIMPRSSLHRFFEKRKERIAAKAPYPKHENKAAVHGSSKA